MVRHCWPRRDLPRCLKVWGLSLQELSEAGGARMRLPTRRHVDGPEDVVPIREHACHCYSTSISQNARLPPRLQTGLAQPSVPSRNVANFSSSAPICAASAPLSSFNCFRFSSSDRFAAIRAAKADDCCGFCEPMLGWSNEEPVEEPDGNIAVGRRPYAISLSCDPIRT